MKKAAIIPTGGEIITGLVADTSSPAVMEVILEHYPMSTVVRAEPVDDETGEIIQAVEMYRDCDLIIVTGGSGGGGRCEPSLAPDITHRVLEQMLASCCVKEIYGSNGHLWSRLVIGRLGKAIVANVPGPTVEAVAVAKAIVRGVAEGIALPVISSRMAEAVLEQYPAGSKFYEYTEA